MRLARPFLLIALILTNGCQEGRSLPAPNNTAFKPAHGLILVTRGTLPQLDEALREYDALTKPVISGRFPVEIHPQPDGSFAVLPPQGLPAYDMVNMTVWLDAPPDQVDTGDAMAWVTSPDGAVAYYLEPERANRWGDTLIGATDDGHQVRVAAPETYLSLATHHVRFKPRPRLVLSRQPKTLVLTLDTDTGISNPQLLLHSDDQT
ncbi:hypothetical protein [Stenotrophomonas sp. Iso1]|uniref:hypothetical protein n=1 Tax=Stenotrophomonas sp. Iso1 TaxID=2977283 RepID=UPI0022B7A70C|nr:hypothetical protein [Stenotrophomonas sp. Iso1]